MGLDTINNPSMRENWRKFIEKAQNELTNTGLKGIVFSTFKNDGSYAKAKTGITSTYWVFAQDSTRYWVELELKARISNGKRCSQKGLYEFIKASYSELNHKTEKIIWDEVDRNNTAAFRKTDSNDLRIKIYLCSSFEGRFNNTEWINIMIQFIQSFNPIIQNYREKI